MKSLKEQFIQGSRVKLLGNIGFCWVLEGDAEPSPSVGSGVAPGAFAICKAVAAKILRVGKDNGMTNLADLFTKVLTVDCCHSQCKHKCIETHIGVAGYLLERS
jgi:hypothetical protein